MAARSSNERGLGRSAKRLADARERLRQRGAVRAVSYALAWRLRRYVARVPGAVRFKRLLVRVWRSVNGVWRRLLFANHRGNAAVFWPDVSGLDRWLLAFWLALLRFHPRMLWLVCSRGHWCRRLRSPLPTTSNRVLHVTASFDLGGTQTQIRNLCNASSGSAIAHAVVEIFPEHNYLYRCGQQLDPARYAGRGRLSRIMGRLILHQGTRSSQIVQVWKLVRDIRAVQPAVVVGWGHELCMVSFIAAAIARVPHIVFCIRTFNPSYGWVAPAMGRLMHVAHRRMLPYVSGVIVNSTPLRADYAAWLGIDEQTVSVCPNGIDAVPVTAAEAVELRERVRRRYGVPDDTLLLIHVGRFSAEKGQMSLMRANRGLLERCPDRKFHWLLCGDGPTMTDVRQYVTDHALDNVIFAGRVNDVHACLAASDIFVMPSDFEGMPNAMMEAMAQGLAAVSTDRSGVVDVARDGVEALYYRPGDVPRLVDHLACLLDHESVRRGLGSRAQARMREFSIARAVETFDQRLAALCGDVAAASPGQLRPFKSA